METFSNPKIEESIKELAFQLFLEEISYKHKYEIETIFDKIKTQVKNLKNKKKEPISFRNAELIELINNNKNSSTNSISSSQSSIKVSSNSTFLSEGLKSYFNSTTDSNSLNIIKYHQNVYNPNPINNPIIIKFSSNPMILSLCYSKQIDVKWHTKESNEGSWGIGTTPLTPSTPHTPQGGVKFPCYNYVIINTFIIILDINSNLIILLENNSNNV